MPISQIISVVCIVNRQRRASYDIFAISPVIEDDGGNEKFDSYNNQSLSDILVFGRHRTRVTHSLIASQLRMTAKANNMSMTFSRLPTTFFPFCAVILVMGPFGVKVECGIPNMQATVI